MVHSREAGILFIVTIVLDEIQYRCLLAHVPQASSAHGALESAHLLPRSAKVHDYWVVECDGDVAGELLTDAQRHCPDAVRPIQVGLRRKRPTY